MISARLTTLTPFLAICTSGKIQRPRIQMLLNKTDNVVKLEKIAENGSKTNYWIEEYN